jgi:hypothetical protein
LAQIGLPTVPVWKPTQAVRSASHGVGAGLIPVGAEGRWSIVERDWTHLDERQSAKRLTNFRNRRNRAAGGRIGEGRMSTHLRRSPLAPVSLFRGGTGQFLQYDGDLRGH